MDRLLLFIAIILLVLVFIGTIFAPLITRYSPYETDSNNRFGPISKDHLLGTDNFGRDIFSRILHGGRITLPMSFAALLVTTIVGTVLGVVAGLYDGSTIASVILRTADILIASPFLVLAMAVIGFFGTGLDKILWLVVATMWAPIARLVRSLSIDVLSSGYVLGSRVSGASNLRIVYKDVLPDIIPQVMVQFILGLSQVILSISTLSFFGLGAQPPTPEWGSMLSDGRVYMSEYPQLLIYTIGAIFIVVVSLNLVGEYYRQKLEPLYVPARWEGMNLWNPPSD